METVEGEIPAGAQGIPLHRLEKGLDELYIGLIGEKMESSWSSHQSHFKEGICENVS